MPTAQPPDQRLLPQAPPAVAARHSASPASARPIVVHASSPQPQATSPTAPKQTRQPGWPALAWGGIGFAAGIAFWHFVGFWGFVSEVVFKAEPGISIAAPARTTMPASAADRRKLQTTIYGGIPASEPAMSSACTLLRLDRNTGRTTALPCEEAALAVAGAPAAAWRRAPAATPPPAATATARRTPAVAGWSTSVEQHADAEPDAGASTTTAREPAH